MAQRVKQADGTYCYTEDCRIHDRSLSDSTGLSAVLSDAKENHRKKLSAVTAEMFHRILEVSEKSSKKFADRAIDNMLGINGEPSSTMIRDALQRLVREETLGAYSWHTMRTSDAIYSELRRQSVISQGDEVILNETGERGTISEGNSTFGGKVLFNPEGTHSLNSFEWFAASEVTKITADHDSLARERILAAPRDALIPASLVKQMIREETNKRTRNPQVAREFNNFGDAVHSKSAMLDFCDDLTLKYGDKGITKQQLVQALQERVETPYQGMGAALPQARKGFRNILHYLDPQKESPIEQ